MTSNEKITLSRLLILIALLLNPCPLFLSAEPLQPSVKAEAALLINADTGAILFDKNPDQVMYPASLTKVATALYVLNRGGVNLDSVVTVEAEALTPTTEAAKKRSNYTQPAYFLETDGTTMGLKIGEQLSIRELLFGAMLVSGNDAANTMAHYVGGSIPQFMHAVNSYLREIGCTSTHYTNPHGLHHPNHVSTARDLALMGCEGLKNATFCEIVSTTRHTKPKTNLQEASTLTLNNLLLRKGPYHYAKAIGIKTGYHSCARHNVLAAARQGDRTLVAVLLRHPDRKEMFKEVTQLFELAFKQPLVERALLEAGPQAMQLRLPGSSRTIETYLPERVTYSYYPAEESKISALLYWDPLVLPVVKGQRVGEIRIMADEKRLLQTVPLHASHDVHPSLIYRLSSMFPPTRPLVLLVCLLTVIAIGAFLFFRSQRLTNSGR